jgi:hypothetical protein
VTDQRDALALERIGEAPSKARVDRDLAQHARVI